MTNLRARIAERLVQAQHTAAILTTFNEADMSAVNALRAKHKESFKAKHGVGLGFMSFFTRACVEAFKVVPEVNASVDGRDVVYHDYVDMGIAVGSDRGLVVPILKDAHKMGFVDIEKKILEYATKAKDGKLSIADITGGTFTISNGGTYGSLLSTPILTPPQAGILGMHKIQDRAMVVEDASKKKTIEIRPMMYLALSYDHRLIDGKGAVTFLVTVKDFLEHPEKLGLNF
jgi:2-oxoglutarate dehydrogenase E2 component (dihydrolipoamide succinyltransferase)